MSDFPYVEIQSGSLTSKWKRILLDEVPKYEAEADGVDFRVSVIRYKNPIPEDGEICISPLFFDVDVKGNLAKALDDTRKVLKYLRDDLQIDEPYPQVWFSGQKGFHIAVHEEVLGIRPDKNLQDIIKGAVDHVRGVLGIDSIDKQIYSKRRIMRFENTKHPDTGLYKIELSYEELMNMTPDEIKKLAEKPRKFNRLVPLERYVPSDVATRWWSAILKDRENRKQQEVFKPRVKIVHVDKEPACIQHFREYGVPDGQRNKAVYVMASYYQNQGLSEKQTREILEEWTRKHYGQEDHKLRERLENAANVAHTVYAEKYWFSCSTARSVDERTAYCVGIDKCKAVENEEDQEPEKVPIVDLADSTKCVYRGKTIRVPIHVISVMKGPYSFPKHIRAFCEEKPENCDGECTKCSLYGTDQKMMNVTMKTRYVMKLFDVSDQLQMDAIKTMMKVSKKCDRAKVVFMQTSDLSTLLVTPMVQSMEEIKRLAVDKDVETKNKFVSMQAYFLGHLNNANERFYATCTQVSDPNTQKTVLLIDHLEPAHTNRESFHPTKEQLELLKVFQQKPGQSVEQKFDEIHDDFEVNVHKVIRRRILGYAIDLAYHTAMHFKFDGEFIKKGWMEVVIVGDSAQGKTKMTYSLMNHYQLGGWTNAEGDSRVGLGFRKYQLSSGQWVVEWGAMPANDGGLLVVDEFSGMNPDAFAELTAARDEGVIEATGSGKGHAAYCRTRMILLSNPRPRSKNRSNDTSMGNFMYGIEAFNELYREHQDSRRVDFAVCLRGDELTAQELNAPIRRKVPHVYTSELCKTLLLWTWTRKKEQVIIEPDVEDEIRAAAIRLCSIYAITTKTWLVDKGTQKYKIARAAVAIAARLFSTDATMQRIIVKKEHVLFAEKIFRMAYDSPGMQYNLFAAHNKSAPFIEETVKRGIERILDENRRDRVTMRNLLKNLCDTSIITNEKLVKFGIIHTKVNEVMDELRDKNLIDSDDMKTKSGVEFFKWLNDKHTRPVT